jgi:hypothetical protein
MTKSTRQPDNAAQSAAFIDKARERQADGDKSTADMLKGRLAQMKPEPPQTKTPAA